MKMEITKTTFDDGSIALSSEHGNISLSATVNGATPTKQKNLGAIEDFQELHDKTVDESVAIRDKLKKDKKKA